MNSVANLQAPHLVSFKSGNDYIKSKTKKNTDQSQQTSTTPNSKQQDLNSRRINSNLIDTVHNIIL